jgi:hypothetical protein
MAAFRQMNFVRFHPKNRLHNHLLVADPLSKLLLNAITETTETN